MAHGEHLIGALVVTIAIAALAEVGRPLRFIIGLLRSALIGTPFLLEGAAMSSILIDMLAGTALIALRIPRGTGRNLYGRLARYLI